MKAYKVIASGSTGNAVIYHNTIMVDCGVPFEKVKPYLYDLQIVLLTHEHPDHLNIATLKKLQFERASLRIGCCSWMFDHLAGLRNIDFYLINCEYSYREIGVMPVKLYHDVPNCGYRIFKNDYKIIHATDTAHLAGIEAKNYNLYALEHNYNEDTIDEQVEKYFYKRGAINTHLSEQQANDFVYNNKGDNYEILRLHESTQV